MIYAYPSSEDAPFERSSFQGIGEVYDRSRSSLDEMLSRISVFSPDVVLVSGWADREYMKICRKLRAENVLVVAGCDTQWKGSLRQQLAGLTASLHVRRSIDVLWVSGERQRILAEALGYSGEKCWDGFYACDWASFADPGAERLKNEEPFFLYVGRYVEIKGIRTLANAYRSHRGRSARPWRLVCAGTGNLQDFLVDAGAEDYGFVQPPKLPALMSKATAFVLPSLREPWGVVVQEAAATGLPLILSDACGAGVHLLRDHLNGMLFPSGNPEALARRMEELSSLPSEIQAEYGKHSFELSKQYTPDRWVQTLTSGLNRQR